MARRRKHKTESASSVALAIVLLLTVCLAEHVLLPGRQSRVLHRAWIQGRYAYAHPMFSPETMKEIYAIHELRGKDKRPRTPFECPDLYSFNR